MKPLTQCLGIFFIQIVLGLCATVWAQTDPTTALPGRWEGSVELPRDPERFLTIESVTAKDGGWEGIGRFGVEAGKGPKVTIKVSLQDGKIVLDFEGGGRLNNPVHLTLVSDNQLEGTANYVVNQNRRTNRRLTLTKVDKK